MAVESVEWQYNGVNMVGVNTTWHYGAPTYIEDYIFQKVGIVGAAESKQNLLSFGSQLMLLCKKDQSIPANAELASVRHLENTSVSQSPVVMPL